MGMELVTKGELQVNVHFVNTPVRCVVEENFGGYHTDQDVLPLAEVLQDQVIVHQSLQRNSQTAMSRASATDSRPDQLESQLAKDEALARELQELEFNQLSDISDSETSETDTTRMESSTVNGEGSSANTSVQVVREDNINPDNMTYEELQTLTETVGTESRGLSEELISFLPRSTYKIGLFSKKDKNEACVICIAAYKNRDKLIRLPCQHQYHKDCVTRWLKINKACPVCNEEVFGS